MSRRWSSISLLLLVGLGMGLRLWHITDRSLWYDEAWSWAVIERFSWAEMIERVGRDVHPPLYFVLLRLWAFCFGTSVLALRSLSVMMAALTIVGTYLFCRDGFRAGGEPDDNSECEARGIGVFAAGFLAVASMHIHWSVEARMYTLGTALAVFSAWLLVRAFQSRRRAAWWWTGYAACAAAFLYTHNYALFTVFGQACFALGYSLQRNRGNGPASTRSLEFGHVCAAFATVGLLYLPWVPTLVEQIHRVQADYWIPEISLWTMPNAWTALILPRNAYLPSSRAVAAAAIVVSAFVLIAFAARERTMGRWLVVALVCAPIAGAVTVSLTTVSVITYRHFLFALVYFVCALACIVWRFFPGAGRYLVAAVILANGIFLHAGYLDELDIAERPGIRGAVEYVRHRREAGDEILALHSCVYFPLRYYWPNSGEPPKLIRPDEIAHYNGQPIFVPEDMVEIAKVRSSQGRRLWVFNTTGFWNTMQPDLGSRWRQLSEEGFPEVYFFQGSVTVTLYERTGETASID